MVWAEVMQISGPTVWANVANVLSEQINHPNRIITQPLLMVWVVFMNFTWSIWLKCHCEVFLIFEVLAVLNLTTRHLKGDAWRPRFTSSAFTPPLVSWSFCRPVGVLFLNQLLHLLIWWLVRGSFLGLLFVSEAWWLSEVSVEILHWYWSTSSSCHGILTTSNTTYHSSMTQVLIGGWPQDPIWLEIDLQSTGLSSWVSKVMSQLRWLNYES